MAKKALILGITGQDGAYLARFLLQKGYQVYGTSRKAEPDSFWRLRLLDIEKDIVIYPARLNYLGEVLKVIQTVNPDEIYQLSGQSSVALSFEQPQETMNSISAATLNVLYAIRQINQDIKLFSACSGECYGSVEFEADEETPFSPVSPYAVAKASVYWLVRCYREIDHLFFCSGILFNHESPLRSENYVTRKITRAVANIKSGKQKKLILGNLNVQRDWGYAPDYVEAMWLMLQKESPDDYVVATGRSISIGDFCQMAFSCVDLDYRDYIDVDAKFFRPNDIVRSVGDPSKIHQQLGWRAQMTIEPLIQLMVDYDLTCVNHMTYSL